MPEIPDSTVPIVLPPPNIVGKMPLEEAIANRRSRRKFGERAIALAELAQLLWSGIGVTGDAAHRRAAPSAGGTHPLNLFAAVAPKGVEGIGAGFYRYREGKHDLVKLSDENLVPKIAEGALGQGAVADAPVVLVVTIEYSRSTARYGERGIRYAHMDAGHLGQNIYLQAEALGLSTVAVGAFDDDVLNELLPLPENYEVKYLFPVGPRK